MTIKVFINSDNTVTFICPQCQKPKIADASRYIKRDTPINLKVSCSCGYRYTAFLDKRKKIRKQARLEGVYRHMKDNPKKPAAACKGRFTVADLSLNGLGVILHETPCFVIGDPLSVRFTLDDANRSVIEKNVVVRNIRDLFANFEFVTQPSYDSVLGFYLFK